MGALRNKKILIAVTGSIAAYKSVLLVRLLVKSGAEVKVVMTESAQHFVSALTFATLSKNPVFTQLNDTQTWNNHVELGIWADLMIVAPATATTLSKMANGLSDNMIIATYLSAKCPVFIAPAMDLDMWHHPSTQQNLHRLQSYGHILIPVGHGELASGLYGDGRMAEPEEIIQALKAYFLSLSDLQGKRVLITAGPTYEALDPVRFIGNYSTGKMGIALASECAARGGEVILVLGPTQEKVEEEWKVVRIQSADEMHSQAMKYYQDCDVLIMAAAVADYTPVNFSSEKIKKDDEIQSVSLKKTIDIAQSIGSVKSDRQIMVGFALETENEEENALRKLKKKNFNFIVLNSLKDEGAGFAHDTNKVTIIHKNGEKKVFSLKSKNEVAKDIVNEVVHILSME